MNQLEPQGICLILIENTNKNLPVTFNISNKFPPPIQNFTFFFQSVTKFMVNTSFYKAIFIKITIMI